MKTIKLNDAIDKDIPKGTPERDDFDKKVKELAHKLWQMHFYPQSQSIIWTIVIIGLLFGIGVITWYLLFIGF